MVPFSEEFYFGLWCALFRGVPSNYNDTDTVDTSSDPPFLGSAHIFHGRPAYLLTYKEAR